MKRIVSLVAFVLFLLNSIAYGQNTNEAVLPKNEISVSASKLTFESFSLKYARNIHKDLWFKVGVIDLEGIFHKNTPLFGDFVSKTASFNGGLLVGVEKQKSTNKWEFTYGLNLQMIYNYSNYTTENPTVPAIRRDIDSYKYSPGIGFGLGFFYRINPSISLGFEINPSVNYAFINGENTSTGYEFRDRDFYFSFTNNGALITLKYKL